MDLDRLFYTIVSCGCILLIVYLMVIAGTLR